MGHCSIFLTFLVLLKRDLLEGTEDVLIKHGWVWHTWQAFQCFMDECVGEHPIILGEVPETKVPRGGLS